MHDKLSVLGAVHFENILSVNKVANMHDKLSVLGAVHFEDILSVNKVVICMTN